MPTTIQPGDDPELFGYCDECDAAYLLTDPHDHCIDCGNCFDHCTCSNEEDQCVVCGDSPYYCICSNGDIGD